jgi:hypothetical protein
MSAADASMGIRSELRSADVMRDGKNTLKANPVSQSLQVRHRDNR